MVGQNLECLKKWDIGADAKWELYRYTSETREMEFGDCCDVYCTSCRIWYLRVLRPGDTVPFRKPKFVLPLGVSEIMIATVVIVLDALALYCQGQKSAAPSPSFLGNPGFPLWLSVLFILDGCINVASYKHKTRFMTAIAFGSSLVATVLVVILLAVINMSIAQELAFYRAKGGASGVVISCVICALVLILLAVTSTSSLLCYLALTSHDDRWFTDRGTQYDSGGSSSGNTGNAKLSVPSGQPAFLFYAPSNEASKYTSVFNDVVNRINDKNRSAMYDECDDETQDGRKTAELSDAGTLEPAAEANGARPKSVVADNYLSTPANL